MLKETEGFQEDNIAKTGNKAYNTCGSLDDAEYFENDSFDAKRVDKIK